MKEIKILRVSGLATTTVLATNIKNLIAKYLTLVVASRKQILTLKD